MSPRPTGVASSPGEPSPGTPRVATLLVYTARRTPAAAHARITFIVPSTLLS